MTDCNDQIKKKGYALNISDDELQASIYITESMQYEFSVQGINTLLQLEHITNGIDQSAIARIITEKILNEEVVVAKGKAQKNGKDGTFHFMFERYPKLTPTILEDGSVDYRDIRLFTFVDKGELLVTYEKATQGFMGFTVTGKLLIPKKGKEKPAIRGSGFIINENATEYYAKLAGKITYTIRSDIEEENADDEYQYIEITSAYIHDSDFLYREGDLDFDGDIFIKGDVQSGVKIKATGDIDIEGCVEAAEIEAGGNVLVKQGVKGAGKGCIRAGGYIHGYFFEAVALNAKEDIWCNYLYDCNAYSGNSIKVSGNKGTIISGNIRSFLQIETFSIGNESGIITNLSAGQISIPEEDYMQLVKAINSTKAEISLFEKNKYETNPFYSKILIAMDMKEKELEELSNKAKDLEMRINLARKTYIKANGVAYAGSNICVNDKTLMLNQSFKSVNFRVVDNHVGVFRN